jgi:tissue inhibitor of metalloproteinase
MGKIVHIAGVLTLTAALLTAVFTGSASACSCMPSSEGERYQRADHVFTGLVVAKVVELGDPATAADDHNRFVVVVSTKYKGDVPNVVNVVSHVQASMCGVQMQERLRYLVFATGDASDRRVEAMLCGGTRSADGGPPVTTTSPTTTTTPTCATNAP